MKIIEEIRNLVPTKQFEEADVVMLVVGNVSYVAKSRYGNAPREAETVEILRNEEPEALRLAQHLVSLTTHANVDSSVALLHIEPD